MSLDPSISASTHPAEMESRSPSINSSIPKPWSWYLLGAAIALLYGPTLWDLFHGLWITEKQGHGPIVMGIAIWLLWRDRTKALSTTPRPSPIGGSISLALGLVMYILGRSQEITLLEVGSSIPVLLGILLLIQGSQAVKAMWFGLFFMFFMIPMPTTVVDALTQPMKLAASFSAEHLLWWLGYPVARSGVILQVGSYQLLVADACSGLHTLFTLEAMGLLYLNIVRHTSALRNVMLAILIVPVSFTANTLRVLTLCLITYHYGDDAGQGFMHSFSGFVLFMSALFFIIVFDGMLRTTSRLVNK